MNDAIDIIAFYTPLPPTKVVDRTLSTFERVGFEVNRDSKSAANVGGQSYDKFDITFKEGRFNVAFNLDESRPSSEPLLSFRCGNLIDPAHANDDQKFHARMDAVFELLCRLAVELDVDYAPLVSPGNRHPTPSDGPIADNLEELPRIGVFDSSVVEDFGGIEAAYGAPPWYTATLEGDKTVVVESERPWDEVGWAPPTEADFLESAVFADPDERANHLESAFEDPFASLDTGEIGTDLCVPREKIGPAFLNEDVELVRVRVDEERNLRRLDDGAFVRNVVDEDPGDDAAFMMAMLEEMPPDATAEDLMVSALLRKIPPAFVHLDEPDGDTIVSTVASLDLEVNKVDLLISLGGIARDEAFTDAQLREMHTLVEQLDSLEEVSGIEQLVRERLL